MQSKIQHSGAGEFTYSNYQSWPARPRYELLDGQAYAMTPPRVAHQTAVFELGRQIGNALEGKDWLGFTGPIGVRLPIAHEADDFIRTVFEPDLIVVSDNKKIDSKGIRGAPDLVIEVLSPTTAAFDAIEKRKAYGAAGVCELWLIDIGNGLITRYRQAAKKTGFDAPEILRAEGEVMLLLGFALSLDFMKNLRVLND